MLISVPLILLAISSTFIVFLGIFIYLKDPKKRINKAFLLLTIFNILWNIFNFLYHQPNINDLALWFLRIHMFFAVWYSFSIFYLYYVFDKEFTAHSKFFNFFLLPWVIFVSFLTLTPLVFEKIISFKPDGTIGEVKTGFGMVFFGLTVVVLLVMFFIGFMIKIFRTKDKIKVYQYIFIFTGAALSFALHFYFNFILPNFFKITKYTILGSLYSLPFISLTFYAILKHKFLDLRIITTDFFIIILTILTASQILVSASFIETLIRFTIFVLILVFGIIVSRSIRREVELREKLEELNRLKSEFLSFASHQLKAPMAVVKGYAGLIMEGIENVPEQAKDFAKKIKESVDNLLVLIEEFMDYRRIEEGKMDLNFEKIDIVSMVKEMVERFKLLAEEKKLILDFESNIDSLITNIDKLRFSQVIQNLIDNAIKYTKEGWVKVKVDKKDNEVLISVSDSGIGMSKELQEKLFGQFVRDPSIKKEIRGTGLGLYIAKYIVEAHQGKIWAESEGIGRGSNFYIKLPLRE